MSLDNFEWEDEIVDISGVGRCFVGYARDESDGQWYRIAIALSELEDLAKRKVTYNEQRKH